MNAMTPPAAILPAFAVGQLAVLRAVQALENGTATGLAERLGKTRNNIVRDLHKLEQHGLVVTEVQGTTGDGRFAEIIATITDEGRDELAAHDNANPVREAEAEAAPAAPATVGLPGAPPPAGFTTLPHHLIQVGPWNPRKTFDPEALQELAADILARGLKQNLHVRPTPPLADGTPCALHELIAGERRFRAIGLLIDRGDLPADWPIPVLIEEMDDQAHALAALLENLQRVDLSPVEEAAAFEGLVKRAGWTTAQVAEKVAKTQRFVQQRLQLNELTDTDKTALHSGQLSVSDARKKLANRPAPLDLTASERLTLAEIIAAANAGHGYAADWRIAVTGCEITTDANARRLVELNLIAIHAPTANYTGYHRAYVFGQAAWRSINAEMAQLLRPDPERAQALLAYRAAVIGSDAAEDLDAAGRYFTAWLNEPHALSTEGAAIQQAIDEAADQRRRVQEEAETQRQAEAEEAAQKHQVELAAGKAFLAAVRDLEARAPALVAAGDFTDAFNQLLAVHNMPGPVSVHRDGKSLVLFDGSGGLIHGLPDRFEAIRRVQAIAMNFAMGLVPTSGPDLECVQAAQGGADDGDRPEPETARDFVNEIARRLTALHGVSPEKATGFALGAFTRARQIDHGETADFGDDSLTTLLDARLIADGWAEDFPEEIEAAQDAGDDADGAE